MKKVSRLEILETSRSGYTVREFAALRSGTWQPSPTGDFALTAVLSCHYHRSRIYTDETRRVWYVFRAGQLVAYDHYECVDNYLRPIEMMFLRLPEGEAQPEAQLAEHLGRALDPKGSFNSTCPSIELFSRALAYASVGRHEDANRMLIEGDEMLRATESQPDRGSLSEKYCNEPARNERDRAVRALETNP